MKISKKLSLFTLCLFATILSTNYAAAQENKKVEKAGTKFCNSINAFSSSLVALDQANESGSVEDINKAYKKAEKAWNKLEKRAAKLENVEIKECAKAYNKLVDAINKIGDDAQTMDVNSKIDNEIDATAVEISNIISGFCG